MELQWPLILFTTFVAWSAGLFGAQGVAVLTGEGKRAQMPALIGSVVLLAIGGIAVFFHLEHWERIFNGFGNPTSGITQELVCIVVMAVLMVALFVMLRKSEGVPDAVAAPKWLAVLMIIASVVTVLVTGHSYMMEARPAWDTVLGPLSLLGVACVLGPATFAVIETIRDEAVGRGIALGAVVGAAANAVLSVAYLLIMEGSTEAYTEVGTYFDPTHPTAGVVDMAALSPFAGESAAMAVVAVICAIAPIVTAVAGKRSGNWKLWGAMTVALAVVGAVALRMAFYSVGASVYLFY